MENMPMLVDEFRTPQLLIDSMEISSRKGKVKVRSYACQDWFVVFKGDALFVRWLPLKQLQGTPTRICKSRLQPGS